MNECVRDFALGKVSRTCTGQATLAAETTMSGALLSQISLHSTAASVSVLQIVKGSDVKWGDSLLSGGEMLPAWLGIALDAQPAPTRYSNALFPKGF